MHKYAPICRRLTRMRCSTSPSTTFTGNPTDRSVSASASCRSVNRVQWYTSVITQNWPTNQFRTTISLNSIAFVCTLYLLHILLYLQRRRIVGVLSSLSNANKITLSICSSFLVSVCKQPLKTRWKFRCKLLCYINLRNLWALIELSQIVLTNTSASFTAYVGFYTDAVCACLFWCASLTVVCCTCGNKLPWTPCFHSLFDNRVLFYVQLEILNYKYGRPKLPS